MPYPRGAMPDNARMAASDKSRKRKHLDAGPLSAALVPALVDLALDVRPSWDRHVVRAVIDAHRTQAPGPALIRAVVDAADDPDVFDPRAIAWALRRASSSALPRCRTCGQTADRCARRPGVDDDHAPDFPEPRST